MKIRHLFERTTDNLQVLNDCIDVLLASMPSKLKANYRDMQMGEEIRGLSPLIRKYDGTAFEGPIRYLARTLIVYDNTAQRVGTGTMGAFHGRPVNELRFYVSAFMDSAEDVSKAAVLAHRLPDKAIKSFRAIMMHELRHLFQSELYQKYFYHRGGEEEDYKTSKVEIDAAWTHHLQDYNPANFGSVGEYVDAVMKSFAGYKKLRGFEKAHFRKKTARYYYEHTGTKTDPLSTTAKDRLTANREGMIKLLTTRLGDVKGLNLQTLPGYSPDAGRFLFPENVIRSVSATVAKAEKVKPDVAALIFFTLSLVATPANAQAIRRFAKNTLGVTIEDALATADKSFAGGFDSEAMKQQIVRAFGG